MHPTEKSDTVLTAAQSRSGLALVQQDEPRSDRHRRRSPSANTEERRSNNHHRDQVASADHHHACLFSQGSYFVQRLALGLRAHLEADIAAAPAPFFLLAPPFPCTGSLLGPGPLPISPVEAA